MRRSLLCDQSRTNPHDRNAVAVLVRDSHVGYLPRADAARYAPVLTELLRAGLLPQAQCTVWGNEYTHVVDYDRRGREQTETTFSASVRLVVDEPHLCVPVNLPPSAPHQLLPYGRAVQVTGEDQHLEAITPLLNVEGNCWAYATLHPITEQLARSTREVLEVRLDGRVAGSLTPKMSAEFLPAVEHVAASGQQTAARARITGNRLKAEIAIHALRAHELDPSWAGTAARSSEDRPDQSTRTPPLEPGPQAVHAQVPPKPTRITFHVPPQWPQPPDGWEPPVGWAPPPEFPPAPADWAFWRLS